MPKQRFIFTLLLSAYALVGIFWLKWNVFYFVYLYWFENVVYVLAHLLKSLSTKHIVDEQGNRATQSTALVGVFSSLFGNFVYLVFIVVGIGVIYPTVVLPREAGKDFVFEMIRIVMFQNQTFNIALISCVVYRLIEYLQECVFSQKYTPQNPLKALFAFHKRDLVLHITILLGMGAAVMLKKPELSAGVGFDMSLMAEYVIGVVMVLVRLSLDLFELRSPK